MIELERAQRIAVEVVKRLCPHCQQIQVAGSIRRLKPWVNDIDLVLIPNDRGAVDRTLRGLGKVKMSGKKIARVGDDFLGIPVDIYFATPETWATLLLIRTGSAGNNIRLATLAKKRGWHLAASGDGLFDEKNERIAGDTELSIYQALGLTYQEPKERG